MEPKDPNEVKEYGINWLPQLRTGEVLVSSTWAIPDTITKDSDLFTNSVTTIWLSGGSAGYCPLTNRVVTSSVPPRTLEKTIIIRVKEL